MTQQQFEKRKERATGDTFVISRTDEGFRVYSPAYPTASYIVGGSPETPTCTCPDFQYHEGDPQWRCKHILAVLNQLNRPGPQVAQTDPYDTEERRAIQDEVPQPGKAEPPAAANGTSQMLLKRSVSPDGRIDSLSVEFSCPVDRESVREIKSRALKTLKLQADIVESFLNGKKAENGERNRNGNDPNGAVPAQMLTIGGMNSKWGRRLFINVQANGQSLKLFGTRKQLAEAISTAGFPNLAERIEEGVRLNIPCRVTTQPSADGKYTNIDRVLPVQIPSRERWVRQ